MNTWNVTAFADDVEREFDRKYRAVIITIYNNLIRLSPVDTGRYRNNHIMSIGNPVYQTDVNGATIAEIPRGSYPSVYLQNNLPYAAVIEFGGYPNPPKRGSYNKRTKSYEIKSINGFSRQAPRGVYRLAFLSALAQFS